MRLRKFAGLGALLVLLGAAPVGAQEHPVFPTAPEVSTLPNGLRVVSVPWNTPGIVAYYTLVNVGSRDEVEPGHSGFAHLFEHMMFRGTERFPAEVYEERIQSFGADNNAYTTSDLTLYSVVAPAENLDEIIEIEGDRFQRLQYSEDVFRTETGAVQGEYAKNASNPLFSMWEALSEMSFSEHTYSHTTMGYLRDICAMPDMYDYSRQFFRRFYTPDNTTVIAVGDVEHAALLRQVRQHYGRWRGRRAQVRVPREPEPTAGATRHIPWDAASPPRMMLGYRVPDFDQGARTAAARREALRDAAALEVIKGLLFGSAAPLHRRLVVEEQRLLSLGSWENDFSVDPGLFVAMAVLRPGEEAPEFEALTGEIQTEIEAIAAGRVPGERIDAVRSHVRYALLGSVETPAEVADLLARFMAVGGTPEALPEYLEALSNLTPSDVARAAERYLGAERRFVVTLAPRTEADGPAPAPSPPCTEAE